MAEPAYNAFPRSDELLLYIKELKNHIDTLSQHLHAVHSHNLSFLEKFSQNVSALHTQLKTPLSTPIGAPTRRVLDEITQSLLTILSTPIELVHTHAHLSLLEAVKNYSNTSSAESDLNFFLTSLEKYPESVRVLIQELDLLSKDLNVYL
jgi:hypothetical protein